MSNFNQETVLSVHHWTDRLFSFKTTRNPAFRFQNGQFTMIGVEVKGRPLVRAYSLVSANYEEKLEFFSIKVADGPLTSRLQHLKEGDAILVSRKATGTLVLDETSISWGPAQVLRHSSASSRIPRPMSALNASSSSTAAAGRPNSPMAN
jgi:ferredoxin-NADP reductase